MNDEQVTEVAVRTFDVSMSPSIGKIASSMAKAQAVMGPAIKDREGIIPGKDGRAGYRYGYATLAACFEALQPFYDNGIAVTQIPLDGGNGVRVLTYLLHESGEWIRGELWMPVEKQTPQGTGSALTYARRYCLQALTGLAADDDDGSVATHGAHAEPTAPKAVKPPVKTKPQPAAVVEKQDPYVSSPEADQMMAAVDDVSTFAGLHKLVMEAQTIPEASRHLLFGALTDRAIDLFEKCETIDAVKAGFPVVTQLGQPQALREAANQAHLRFRTGAQ
jgi:hypothetical protein